MKHIGFRRALRGLLAVSVVLPFFVFSKATLMTFGGPLVWLLGYPLLVAVLFAATAERTGTKRIHATLVSEDATEAPDTVSDEVQDEMQDRFNSPLFSFLSCNIHHRS